MLIKHLKIILLLCLLFSVITEAVIIVIDQIQFDWSTEMIRYVIAPMIMVFFIFVLTRVLDHGQSIKQGILSTISTFENKSNLISIGAIYLTYVFCYNVPGRLIRLLFDPYFRGHSPLAEGQFDYGLYSMIYGSQVISAIIEVLILTTIVGAALHVSRSDQRYISEQN